SDKIAEPEPENMEFIPGGSFIMTIDENDKTLEVSVSVDAFWMSNEITNSEYREYINYVKDHPNNEMCWIDLARAAKKNESSEAKEGMKSFLICVKYSEIADDIIDFTKLPYEDYFTNKKYNDFPVVGISHKHASYFCIWKTQIENDKLKKEGKPAIHDYRLPVEAEWAYVASHTQITKNKNDVDQKIRPSRSGKKNEFGLYNLAGNVSEWTISHHQSRWSGKEINDSQDHMKIIRGGSWKTSSNTDMRIESDKSEAENYVGFRIVRSYTGINNAL
ncbi:MAG: SUMF1/EgtB/PvdO family nonheme iron enzyme, partial [Bacteroidales bacterium]|nr:SUMF1/EgtB/PvdO family nonheme iron enzyme [Bacteroidales bacterium]